MNKKLSFFSRSFFFCCCVFRRRWWWVKHTRLYMNIVLIVLNNLLFPPCCRRRFLRLAWRWGSQVLCFSWCLCDMSSFLTHQEGSRVLFVCVGWDLWKGFITHPVEVEGEKPNTRSVVTSVKDRMSNRREETRKIICFIT